MSSLFDLAPLAAAVMAIPQFWPQLRKVGRTGDASGVSMSWAVLTSTNNAAWTVYFALSGFWTALVPSVSATAAGRRARVRDPPPRSDRPSPCCVDRRVGGVARRRHRARWPGGSGDAVVGGVRRAGRPGDLGRLRSPTLTGVAVGTWLLVAGELACWGVYGVHRHDPRLMTMGVIGITAAGLMLARVHATRTRPGSDPRGTTMATTSTHQPVDDMPAADLVGGAPA